MIKIIFCDLDDTLLTPITKEIKNEDIESINHWIKSGNLFVIATARHHSFLNNITNNKYHFDFDCVGWNGAEIYYQSKVTEISPFKKPQFLCLYENMKEYKKYIKVTNEKNEYIYENQDSYAKEIFIKESSQLKNVKLHDYLKYSDLSITHVNYIFPNKQLHLKFHEDYNEKMINFDDYNCRVTSDLSYDITVKKASKEEGIKRYLKLFKIQEDQIATIGDSLNDIGMFKLAKQSFCMENGNKEAKKIAKYTVKSVSEAISILERINKYGR